MRFAIDMDGVLSDFTYSVIATANSIWPGKIPLNYVPDNWMYEGMITEDEWDVIWRAIRATPYFWEGQTALPGFLELRAGITPEDEIFFITAREDTVGEPASVQSARWLHHRLLWPRSGYSNLLQVTNSKKKEHLIYGLNIKSMLDDYAPTVKRLNEVGVQCFLLDQPWNRYATELPRVFSVTEYLEKIKTL